MNDVDKYLAAQPDDVRASLERLRATIKSAAPAAEEKISYRMPMFMHHGMLVSYAAFKNHCSFFVMSGKLLSDYEKELARFVTTKGSIHFTVEKPLPVTLIRKLVKARVAQNEAKLKAKQAKKSKKK